MKRTLIIPLILLLFLLIFPAINSSSSLLILITQIFLLAVFAMSYDILLGYSGILSFGHSLFFGVGAFTTAILMRDMGNEYNIFFLSLLIAIVLSVLFSLVIGILSLRLKSHYFAMITLAISSLMVVIAKKWRTLTNGNDGFTFAIPEIFKDRVLFYFIALVFMVLMFILLKTFINSPVGRIIQGIRENEERISSLGYNVLHYKMIASILAGIVASLTGSMYIITLRFVNTSMLDVHITLDALIMTVIGGVGTLWGGMIGAFLYKTTQFWLSEMSDIHWIFDRWNLVFGLALVMFAIFFPKGIMGGVRKIYSTFNLKKQSKLKEAKN